MDRSGHFRTRAAFTRRMALACIAAPLLTGFAHAQSARPLRIIVPYAPGGTGDVIARLVAQEITQGNGQSVVVENRPGGAGVIGASAAAKADADGSTLLLGYTSELVISPHLIKGGVSYATDRDFKPVAFAGATPLLLIAGNNVPGANLSEFIAAAKSKPGTYSYATAGNGSPAHIAGALLAKLTGTQLLNVPYKGGAQAVTDVVAGNASIYFSGMPPAVPLVKSGKVKAFGVAAKTPSPALPSVPALATAYPELDLSGWFGFLAPAATPQPVVDALHAKLVAVLQSPTVKARLLDNGVETRPMSAADFGAFLKAEQAKYSRLIESLDIHGD
ncbi:MAG TPA: tripartite tricarboxylate transporter substrate-binding protein [Ramlibacter sp.]|uniref:Bug family tripartite tricarboxylate transporter substrate binding protein n=1 Tax=Ramlibacter sp. TaxID=1917967 RepID=UPI002D13BAE7|nr:tripartite tricarboxylate transporter substrate-binding protein [Ramlibacter sp.]HVZ46889.1 tripartite tricarboxylate transporter substrate-binding protein [Ramlibacter sp.]